MSEVRVNNIVDYGGKGAPTFDNGAVISGVSSLGNQAKIGSNVTITSGGINVSGVTTAATLSGNLTGDVNSGFVTATSAVIGSGVTINAGGLNITGVMTATTFKGDGSTMTGVAMTITPLAYNPDVSDSVVPKTTGIGITFDHRLLAGSGNITLSIATNAGAAGTVVENFGVGSSVTISGRHASIDPTSDLTAGETYHISYPSGSFTNTSGDVSYVGTAYTFGVKPPVYQLFAWGQNTYGELANNQNSNYYSSPVQIPGTNWSGDKGSEMGTGQNTSLFAKTDGTLWSWGYQHSGGNGVNNLVKYSSPVQIPGTTWTGAGIGGGGGQSFNIKTDGTLWAWGTNTFGTLAQNNRTQYSSPVQIPGTNWRTIQGASNFVIGTKTDGTAWWWGHTEKGSSGDSSPHDSRRSSPTQIPGDWSNHKGFATANIGNAGAIKSDGTLWMWGDNDYGELGVNDRTTRSSPVQIPGTSWKELEMTWDAGIGAIRTDGTLWVWGRTYEGNLGLNAPASEYKSSPTQVGSDTTWNKLACIANRNLAAIKTDGTAWAWGDNQFGQLAQNNRTQYSSPVQIGSDTNWYNLTSHMATWTRNAQGLKEV
jgi:alpha-tubulin suppressor-like RCC1 family protein